MREIKAAERMVVRQERNALQDSKAMGLISAPSGVRPASQRRATILPGGLT
jgi:hypothetical protein